MFQDAEPVASVLALGHFRLALRAGESLGRMKVYENPAALRRLADLFREDIRQERVACINGVCRHGQPDIYHPPECKWQQAVEAVYRIERELENNDRE